MSTVINGGLILSVLLATVLLLTSTFINTTALQATALEDARQSQEERLAENISISSTSASEIDGSLQVTVTVENAGKRSISDFSNMDVLIRYIDLLGNLKVKRLAYVSSAPPGADQWTVMSIQPDSFNPGIWDPDETVTIRMRLVPLVSLDGNGTVAIVTPRGSSDSAYFGN